jgi:PilZ domain-containing protein
MAAMATSADRRKRKRVALHWPVRLFQPGRPSVVITTENLSSEGFFCITKQPFRLDGRLQCEIVIPVESIGAEEAPLRLQCQVTVRRVEALRAGFGLGCRIEDYSLATGSPAPAP